MPSAVAIAIGPSPVMGLFVFPMSWILLMVSVNFSNALFFFKKKKDFIQQGSGRNLLIVATQLIKSILRIYLHCASTDEL